LAQAVTRPFSLDPGIDAEALRAAFAARGRVQFSPFLSGDGAERLRAHIDARGDWKVALNADGKTLLEFEGDAWMTMNAFHRDGLRKIVEPRGETGFRHMFRQIVAAADEGPTETDSELGRFAAFLSSPEVIGLIRTIAGAADIDCADARATRYLPGDFLTLHNDRDPPGHRRVAYVLGLTPAWRAEWGGLLMFHNSRGDVEEGLLPRMDTLNLFSVPQRHSVSLVAPFAPVPRHSVSGWFKCGTPRAASLIT
jgi:SM-20-related protein